jgi:hypothetical protein
MYLLFVSILSLHQNITVFKPFTICRYNEKSWRTTYFTWRLVFKNDDLQLRVANYLKIFQLAWQKSKPFCKTVFFKRWSKWDQPPEIKAVSKCLVVQLPKSLYWRKNKLNASLKQFVPILSHIKKIFLEISGHCRFFFISLLFISSAEFSASVAQ